MLKKLRLERFKNFKEAELILGSLTLLVGTNASGKSNIRDAFRFLHGISRNYNLAEIFGEKWIEGGVLQWRGIRGGTREVTFQGQSTFALEVSLPIGEKDSLKEATYRIEVNPGTSSKPATVIAERLLIAGEKDSVFEAAYSEQGQNNLSVKLNGVLLNDPTQTFTDYRPIVAQMAAMTASPSVRGAAQAVMKALSSMRFLDLNPDAMRLPSLPGQTILGDRGENLSSVLQKICENPESKQALLQWVQELTPMDAMDFEFPGDFTGKILLTLIEENGQKTSAISASDGTLRFLAMIATLLGSEAAQFYFFEEAENAWQEIEVWVLAGHDLPSDWNWQVIRDEVNPKETYFLPFATQRKLLDAPGEGRKTLAEEAARRYDRIRQLCPEDIADLEDRVRSFVEGNT